MKNHIVFVADNEMHDIRDHMTLFNPENESIFDYINRLPIDLVSPILAVDKPIGNTKLLTKIEELYGKFLPEDISIIDCTLRFESHYIVDVPLRVAQQCLGTFDDYDNFVVVIPEKYMDNFAYIRVAIDHEDDQSCDVVKYYKEINTVKLINAWIKLGCPKVIVPVN